MVAWEDIEHWQHLADELALQGCTNPRVIDRAFLWRFAENLDYTTFKVSRSFEEIKSWLNRQCCGKFFDGVDGWYIGVNHGH